MAQNKYISSKRASRVSGYAQDYIGQLVRMGKLPATKVGRAWFVDENLLLSLVHGSSRVDSPAKELAKIVHTQKSESKYVSKVSVGIEYPRTWSPIRYEQDRSPLFPVSDSRDTNESKAISITGAENVSAEYAHNESGTGITIRNATVSGGSLRELAGSIDGIRHSAYKLGSSQLIQVPRESAYVASGMIIGQQNGNSYTSAEPDSMHLAGRSYLSYFGALVAVLIALFLIPVIG